MTTLLKKIDPNYITAARLFLLPLVLWGQQTGRLGLALILLTVSEITDILDGRLARFNGQVSNFGKMFDPYCDSISRCLLFLGFMASGWMPFWMVTIIFVRDITVAYIRSDAANNGVIMHARWSGKYIKAVSQVTAQIITILVYMFPEHHKALPLQEISWWSLCVASLATSYTGLDYVLAWYKETKKRR